MQAVVFFQQQLWRFLEIRVGNDAVRRAVWPWLLTVLVFLIVVTYIPQVSLWLPRLLGMM